MEDSLADPQTFSIEDIIGGSLDRPEVSKIPWMGDVEMRLATGEDLDRIAEECIESGLYALDLETTGLDVRVFRGEDGRPYTNDKIVGFCIAPTDDLGYYIPVRHKDTDANVPARLVAAMVNKVNKAGAVAVFHNAKFDQEFLEHDAHGPIGDWSKTDLWEDTIILAYLRNSRERNKGLKVLSKRDLGMEMIELKDLFPVEDVKRKDLDFSKLDPTWEPCVWYAASDAICTRRLFGVLHDEVVNRDDHGFSQRTIYRLEKGCVTATRWMERCRIHVDRDKVEDLIRLGQEEWFTSLKDVYEEGEIKLGRDIRPLWFKMMIGDYHPDRGGTDLEFDPNSLAPTYMEARGIAMAEAGKDAEDPVEKSVPSLVNPSQQETVAFPATYDIT